ncbi:MAG: AmmeMemoRadiSam system protein B [Acidobacteriota bacterium]
MIREPAVAGQFYPADPAVLRAEVERLLRPAVQGEAAAARDRAETLALVVPHAGYIYSGRIAGAVYAASRLRRDLVILCPNHTGQGRPVALMNRGAWRTPLGSVAIDEDLADRVLRCCPYAEIDDRAHRREHSLEVQIPFLQSKLGSFSFVPICVASLDLPDLLQLGSGLSRALSEPSVSASIIISSDMSHYIPADEARRKDGLAINEILRLDSAGLDRVVREHGISMCGIAPAVVGLAAAKAAGARWAQLIAYGHSGDVTGDHASVVGYAGLTIS